ncbi:MAG: 30S ribosomal protein S4 [Pseudomonadota bacterium]
MARNFAPRGRQERREKQDLSLFSGVTSRESKIRHQVVPGGLKGTRLSKLSNFGLQLREKQKVKRIYGVLEKQFRNLFKKAARKKGSTGENLLQLLECRLDNVIYQSGWARTRKEARQLVGHKAVLVNGQTVNIPSFSVSAGDEIAIREQAKNQGRVQDAINLAENRGGIEWLEIDHKKKTGVIKRLPERDDISPSINEQLIVELYSK